MNKLWQNRKIWTMKNSDNKDENYNKKMEERSCMENLNGNIVEDIYGIKIAFEGYYETLLKINPQSNISSCTRTCLLINCLVSLKQ